MGGLQSPVAKVLAILSILAGIAYYFLCLLAYGAWSVGWLIAALLLPPLDIAYPLVQWARFKVVPWGLVGVGLACVSLFLIAVLFEAVEERERERFPE